MKRKRHSEEEIIAILKEHESDRIMARTTMVEAAKAAVEP